MNKKGGDICISDLEGKTLLGYHIYDDDGDNIITLYDKSYNYNFYHEQECCEHVFLEGKGELLKSEIEGILNSPIVLAEERIKEIDDPCETFTFYTMRTQKDTLTLRFVGISNGYYSERVFIRASLREIHQ